MSDHADPADFACPDGSASGSTGDGARDCAGSGSHNCPSGGPPHDRDDRDGCPACYVGQQRRERALLNETEEKMNEKVSEIEITEKDAVEQDGYGESLETELYVLRETAQSVNPANIASLELRAGATDPYPEPDTPWVEPDTPLVLALVRQYQEKALDLHDFVYALSGVKWNICAWGSCQYATIFAMFRALICLKRAGLDPTEVMGWGKVADLIPDAAPTAEVLDRIANEITADICKEAMEDGETPDAHMLAEAHALRKCATLDRAFALMRKRAWDLWTAASYTAELVFKTDFEHVESNVNASPGVGWSINIRIQSTNYTAALRCFLLFEAGYVADPDTAYARFDT